MPRSANSRRIDRIAPAPQEGADVVQLPFAADDDALLERLQRGEPAAIAALCDRHGPHVRRVLGRILGTSPDVADLHQEVFIRAIRYAPKLKHARSLSGWLSSIAVNVARSHLRRMSRRRWFSWSAATEPVATRDDDAAEALARTYEVLASLNADDRIVFALRFVDGMALCDIAEATGVSLATVKRRLSRAQERFVRRARKDEVLLTWLEEGDRWS